MLLLPEPAPARGQPFPFFSLQQALRPHPSEILTSAPRLHGDSLPRPAQVTTAPGEGSSERTRDPGSPPLWCTRRPGHARATLTGQPGAFPPPSFRRLRLGRPRAQPSSTTSSTDLPLGAEEAPARRQRYLGVRRAKLRGPELEAELQPPESSAARGSRHGTPLPRGLRGTLARRSAC